MTRLAWLPVLLCAPVLSALEPSKPAPPAAGADTYRDTVKPFLAAHCLKCHGPEKPAGGVRLDDLPNDPTKDVERWAAVGEQLRDGLMPPAKEARPDAAKGRAVVAWVVEKAGGR